VGRPPIGIEHMLRMYCVQQWFGLSDEGVEDALYDSQALRHFVGIDLSRESAPDATTLLKFRRLLEDNNLTAAMFEEVKVLLSEKGLLMREGTTVDATIIAAPPSTKNKCKARDPEMHQTKKGNQWYFGMKAHIGADAESGLVHSLHVTSANESDVAHTYELLHGQGHRLERGDQTQQDQGDARGGSQGFGDLGRASQGADSRLCRASIPCFEEPVSSQEGQIQGLGQERGAVVQPVWVGQFGEP
jgi:IS5 family transposase